MAATSAAADSLGDSPGPAAAGGPSAASAAQHAARVAAAEAYTKACIAGHDSSHDWWHIDRVRNSAAALARQEGLQEAEQQLAELAALLHDVADHKYSSDPDADRACLAAFLAHDLGLSEAEQGAVLCVIDSMGFNAELARQHAQQAEQRQGAEQQGAEQQAAVAEWEAARQRMLAVVQDADRLDAIGAVGIARCLTFGGRFSRVLHDPAVPPRDTLTRQQYMDKAASAQQTTINHFHEKLLRLKGLMRTGAGRAAAEGRHAFMEAFLQQFQAEWRGEA
ncbi:hypothetical protein ABPG75_013933 [Micractinium tetrahymenae]